MTRSTFLTAASERRLLLDGAMATYVHATSGDRAPARACDGLSRSDPARLRQVHDAYLDAGADIVRTNTFRTVAREHARDAAAICRAATRVAREAARHWSQRIADRPRFVAGALGPPDSRDSNEQARTAFRVPLRALLESRVDLVLFETCYQPAHAAAGLAAYADAAADAGRAVPVLVSIALDAAGRLAVSGAAIDDVLAVIDPSVVAGLGVNCGTGPDGLAGALAALRPHATIVTCHPSAGLPDSSGRFPIGPADFAARVSPYAAAGLADVLGGCCGTTPLHVAALARDGRQ